MKYAQAIAAAAAQVNTAPGSADTLRYLEDRALDLVRSQATHYRVPPSSTPKLPSDSVGRP
jgi:hypothetical protein